MSPETPREAGRETDVVCQCGHARSCHGTVFQTPSEKTGACLANERCLCLVYRAAAPTAEAQPTRLPVSPAESILSALRLYRWSITSGESWTPLCDAAWATAAGALATLISEADAAGALRTENTALFDAIGALRSNGTTDGHEPDVLPQGMAFHAGELGDAYVAGAKSARAHHPASDDLIARSCDAYVKHAHLVRRDGAA